MVAPGPSRPLVSIVLPVVKVLMVPLHVPVRSMVLTGRGDHGRVRRVVLRHWAHWHGRVWIGVLSRDVGHGGLLLHLDLLTACGVRPAVVLYAAMIEPVIGHSLVLVVPDQATLIPISALRLLLLLDPKVLVQMRIADTRWRLHEL